MFLLSLLLAPVLLVSAASTSANPMAAAGPSEEASSSSCSVGFYLPNSTTSCEACPADHFCSGSSTPEKCAVNGSAFCDDPDFNIGGSIYMSCQHENGQSLCVDGQCSGLDMGNLVCINEAGRVQIIDFETCSSLFAAGFRREGEVGCAAGSICAEFQNIEVKLQNLYNLNLVDAILEFVGAVVTLVYLWANYYDNHKLSMYFNRFNVYVIMVFDVIIQISVLSISMDSSFHTVLSKVKNGLCWNLRSDANDILNDVVGGLEWINVLGWLELCIVVIALSSAFYDRVKEDEDREKDKPWFERFGLAVSIMAIFFDLVLSSIDFFKFTIDSQRDFQELAASVRSEENVFVDSMGGWQDDIGLQKCITVVNVADYLVPTMSKDNCLEAPLALSHHGMPGWGISMLILCLCWAGGMAAIVWRWHKYGLGREGVVEEASDPMTMEELREELEDQKEVNRKRQESSDRKDEMLRKKVRDVEETQKELERVKVELEKAKKDKDKTYEDPKMLKKRFSSFGNVISMGNLFEKKEEGVKDNDKNLAREVEMQALQAIVKIEDSGKGTFV